VRATNSPAIRARVHRRERAWARVLATRSRSVVPRRMSSDVMTCINWSRSLRVHGGLLAVDGDGGTGRDQRSSCVSERVKRGQDILLPNVAIELSIPPSTSISHFFTSGALALLYRPSADCSPLAHPHPSQVPLLRTPSGERNPSPHLPTFSIQYSALASAPVKKHQRPPSQPHQSTPTARSAPASRTCEAPAEAEFQVLRRILRRERDSE
jgi:hypothetical protein